MLLVNADRKVITQEFLGKLYSEIKDVVGEDVDKWLKACRWIIPLDVWFQIENAALVVEQVIVNQLADEHKLPELRRKDFPPPTLFGAPVYRHLSGSVGIVGEQTAADMLLITPGAPPEVFLRVTAVGLNP